MILPGDGIGPEIVDAAKRVLDAAGEKFGYVLDLRGRRHGRRAPSTSSARPCQTGLLERCQAADAVLLGAVGGPKWDTTDPHKPRPEQGLLGLRKGLGLYANLRPVQSLPGAASTPARCKPERDRRRRPARRARAHRRHLLRRARTRDAPTRAYDTMRLHRATRSTRLARVRLRGRRGGARGKLVTLGRQGQRARDLAALARAVAMRVAERYPDVELRAHARRQRAMQLVRDPRAVRRDRHREHVRRHPQRRGGDAHRLASACCRRRALGAERRRPVRADPRLGARHRRHGAGQPARDHPVAPR